MAHPRPPATVSHAAAASLPLDGGKRPHPVVGEVKQLMARGRYADALGLTRGKGSGEPQLQNVRGVCLLRTGQVDDALMLFRGMALQTGGVSVRKDCPPLIAINFATALLLSGHPAGCLEVMRELPASLNTVEAAAVAQLGRALRDWEGRLSWWGWLDWKINRIASTRVPVRIEGEPGLTGWEAEWAEARQAAAATS